MCIYNENQIKKVKLIILVHMDTAYWIIIPNAVHHIRTLPRNNLIYNLTLDALLLKLIMYE